ncbi:MAG: TIGR03915 family putative DNA repair protein [Oscillospiraceae bacterium]|nr:TIGR03915 family putative DNA repair protein [Oscillospiraceae bacterium]
MTTTQQIFTYDGSFDGFLTVIYHCFHERARPLDIAAEDSYASLFPPRFIPADTALSGRVWDSIPRKISSETAQLVTDVFYSCMPQKELALLNFLLRAYKEGGRLLNSLGDPMIAPLLKARGHLRIEAHKLVGFVRFRDTAGGLVSEITPKNFILPYIADHFMMRYDNEDFAIHDKTHGAVLVWAKGEDGARKSDIFQVDSIEFPESSAEEERFESLWKLFYATVAIKERYNPRCRMTLMPKRYWANMLEVKEELGRG